MLAHLHVCSASNDEDMTDTAFLYIESDSCTVICSIVLLYRGDMFSTAWSYNGSLLVLLKCQSGILYDVRFAKVLTTFWKQENGWKTALVFGMWFTMSMYLLSIYDSIFGFVANRCFHTLFMWFYSSVS